MGTQRVPKNNVIFKFNPKTTATKMDFIMELKLEKENLKLIFTICTAEKETIFYENNTAAGSPDHCVCCI